MSNEVPFKIRWLSGGVPDHWQIVEPRRIFKLVKEPERPGDVHLTPSQKYGVLPQEEYMKITGARVVQNLSGTQMQHVEPGDFISHLRTFQSGLELATMPGKVSPAYTVLRPTEAVYPGFFKYVLKSPGYVSQIASVTDQLRDGQTMRYNEFNLTWLPLPPLEEQKRIADELDRELAEIDEFIADQQRLLDLEDERFKASITSLVHPEPIKDIFDTCLDSIEWNGTTWRLTHLGMVTRINGGQVDPREEPYSSMKLIAPNHIESGTGKILYTETAAEQGADSGKYLVNKGQVIFSKIRPTLLKSTIAPEDCLCSADMYGMSANPEYLTNEFLMWFLLSKPFETFARINSDRVAMPKLNRDTLSTIPLWLPNLNYQFSLDSHLKAPDAEINKLLIQKTINLLKEKYATYNTLFIK